MQSHQGQTRGHRLSGCFLAPQCIRVMCALPLLSSHTVLPAPGLPGPDTGWWPTWAQTSTAAGSRGSFQSLFFSLPVLCRVSCLLLGPDALQVTAKHLCWLQLPEKYWSLFQVLCLQAGANALSATYTKQRRLTISLYFSLGPSASSDLALELLFLCPCGLAWERYESSRRAWSVGEYLIPQMSWRYQ